MVTVLERWTDTRTPLWPGEKLSAIGTIFKVSVSMKVWESELLECMIIIAKLIREQKDMAFILVIYAMGLGLENNEAL